MLTHKKLLPIVAIACLFSAKINADYSPTTNTDIDHIISLNAVQQDMQFLASDERQGRAIDSQGIMDTEDYIAQEFLKAGLKPYGDNQTFKQKFQIHQYIPKEIKVTINHSDIPAKSLTFIGNQPIIEWNESNTSLVTISATDNFKERLTRLNNEGKSALVLVHSSHEEAFTRYQQYFKRGSKTTKLKVPASLVIALTDLSDISQFDVIGKIEHKEINVANLVAVLPGTDIADEFIIYSAHHDHLGIKENSTTDKIYNGANDDASGVTAVLNLARHFSKKQHKRSIMFVTFTAEESGLIGSNYFTDFIDVSKVKAMINIEMIGKASEFGPGKYWMTGFERSNLAAIFNQNLKVKNTEIYADPYLKYGLFYRSDNASLAKLGIAAHSFSSTQISNDDDYHQASDDLASLDLEQMTDIINSIALGSQSLLNGTDTPSRIELPEPTKPGLIY